MNLQMNQTVLTTISNAYQTAVPSVVRKILNVKRGDKLVWRIHRDTKTVVVKEAPKDWGAYLQGAGKGVYGNVKKYMEDLRRDRAHS